MVSSWDGMEVWAGPEVEGRRMQLLKVTSFEQFLLFPDGTEVFMCSVAPLGLGMALVSLVMNEAAREQTREYIANGDDWDFAFVVYLLPDGIEVPSELLIDSNTDTTEGE